MLHETWNVVALSGQAESGRPSATLPPIQSKVKPTSVVYWLRFLLAVAAGFTNNYLHIGTGTLGDLALFAGISLGVVFYVISVVIIRFVLRYDENQLRGKNRYVTLGGGTFIVVWVMVSVILNTLTGG